MRPWLLVVISASLMLATESAPSSSKQVQFIKNGSTRRYETSTKKKSQRPTRSFGDVDVEIELWSDPSLAFLHSPQSNSIAFDLGRNGHITPDFSNGLDYPDPLLVTGLAAKRMASYLYSRELFFGNIPHVRAILGNQEVRKINGLAGNRLGSMRHESPFYRFKHEGSHRFF